MARTSVIKGSISMKKLYLAKAIALVSPMNYNTNGYPFLTLTDNKRKATNVYFGKERAEALQATFEKGDSVKELIKDLSVMHLVYDDGEVRYKFAFPNGNNYVSSSDLADMFGVEEPEAEFDIVAFKGTFQAAPEVTTIPA